MLSCKQNISILNDASIFEKSFKWWSDLFIDVVIIVDG